MLPRMRVLIVNLTRFGDLLQTQPLIREFKEQGHEVTLVCLDNFARAAALLDGVDRLVPLRGSRLLADLDAKWSAALADLETWAAGLLRDGPPDRVINLTASLSGRLLARRLARGIRPGGSSGGAPGGCCKGTPEGFGLDEHGFGSSSSLWTSFLEASSRRRGCSPYNLSDLFRKAAGFGHGPGNARLRPPSPAVQREMRGRLRAAAPSCSGFVAFQPGASEERRRWPVEHFAVLGRLLHERLGLMPVLLGSASERPLGEAYLSARGPGIDLTGRTELEQLAAVLRSCRLLVTNDTGTMHLSAGLGVPCVALFLATAQPWDTGPYLEDCCCLEPDLPCHPCGFGSACPNGEICRTAVSPETVAALVEERLTSGNWPRCAGPAPEPVLSGPLSAVLPGGARIWRTRRQGAFLDLESLSGHENSPRTVWLRLQRHFYRQFLDRESGLPGEGKCLPPPELAAALPADRRVRALETLNRMEQWLQLLAEQGRLLLQGAGPGAGQRFLGTVHRLTSLLDASEDFNALGRLWFTASQERGGDLGGVLNLVQGLRQLARDWRQALESPSE